MSRGTPLVFLSIGLFALSGCASGSDDGFGLGDGGNGGQTPGGFSEDTGAIVGKVTDDALFPLGGAQVGIGDLDIVTLSTAEGDFEIGGLYPGSYTVAAQKLGYASGARQVDVVAGQASRVDFALAPLAIVEAYIDLQKWSGFLECQVGTSAVLANCVPIQNIINQFNLPNPTNTRQIAFWNVSEPREAIEGGLYELVWERSTGFSGEFLTLIVEEENSGLAGNTFGQEGGTSPVRVRIGDGPYQDLEPENEENDQIQTRVFASGATPPNLVFMQPFDIYSSVFYYADPGDTYTALADA